MSNKGNFDNLVVGNYFVGTDGYRYPNDAVIINHARNEYLDQYRDRKSIYTDYLGEGLLNPLIYYPDMTTKAHNQVSGLRHQVDHITPKNIQLCVEYRNNRANARLIKKLIR